MTTNQNDQPAHLVHISTGKILSASDKVPIVKGVMAQGRNNLIKIDEIVLPTDSQPEGLIKFNVKSEGIPSHQKLRPDVIGAMFVSQAWIESAIQSKAKMNRETL